MRAQNPAAIRAPIRARRRGSSATGRRPVGFPV